MNYFNNLSPAYNAKNQRNVVFARSVTLAITLLAICILGLSAVVDSATSINPAFLYPRVQAVVILVSFLLIGLLSPAWSTSLAGFASITTTLLATLALVLSPTLSGNMLSCIAVFALGWGGLTLSTYKDATTFRILLCYGVVITGCFLLGLRVAELRQPLFTLGFLLILGAFPIAAWQPFVFKKVSAGVCASFVILQQVMAQKIGAFFEADSIANTQVIFFVSASLSSLMALYQHKGQRALAAFAASQSLFIAYCFLSPSNDLQEARLFIANANAIATPGFILVLGLLESRTGALFLARPSGNYSAYPRLANSILLFGLMSAAFPLTLGFVGVDLVIETLFHNSPFIVIGWLGILALNAMFAMKCFLYLCLGKANDTTSMDILPFKYLFVCSVIALSLISAFALPLLQYLLY